MIPIASVVDVNQLLQAIVASIKMCIRDSSPDTMRSRILEEIEATIQAHQDGIDAKISMKMNSLVDAKCIAALYEASRAGVPIELNIRGICCLRPGVEGVSENIRVTSVVGSFLEHSRVYSFRRGTETAVFIGSADLMPRNLDSRVELVTPIFDETARDQVLEPDRELLAAADQDFGQLLCLRHRGLYLVEVEEICGLFDVVDDVVEPGGQRVDVLAVDRGHEGRVEALDDVVRDPVAFLLGDQDLPADVLVIGPGCHHLVEHLRRAQRVLTALTEEVEEGTVAWDE